MAKKRPPPKTTKEFTRFKDFLRRLVAVPKAEVDAKMAEHREQSRRSRIKPRREKKSQ